MTTLEREIQGVIDKYVSKLFEKLVVVNGVNRDELNNMWSEITGSNVGVAGTSDVCLAPVNTAPVSEAAGSAGPIGIDPVKIMGATVPELKAMCKANKLSTGGKKQDLVDRLVSLVNANNPDASKQGDAEAQVVPAPKKKKRSPNRMPNIPISSIQIKKNDHGNYEHPETKLVFDKETKQVIGKQHDDGSITTLTEEDIQQCDQFKFNYKIPEKIITEGEKHLTSVSNDDDIVETLDDIIGSDDDGEFEEFYEEDE
jgi:hypothetical protein